MSDKPTLAAALSKDKAKPATPNADTAAAQKTAKQQRQVAKFKKYHELLPYLQKQYPKCFPSSPIPLAIGIHTQLLDREREKLPETDIKLFLSVYANTAKYNESMLEGTSRVDLDGNATDELTQEDAACAKGKLKAILAARERNSPSKAKATTEVETTANTKETSSSGTPNAL